MSYHRIWKQIRVKSKYTNELRWLDLILKERAAAASDAHCTVAMMCLKNCICKTPKTKAHSFCFGMSIYVMGFAVVLYFLRFENTVG